jgi:tetratricopeptide (TPR) repeat protein
VVVAFPWRAVGKRLAAQAAVYAAPVLIVIDRFPNGVLWLNLATAMVFAHVSVALHEAAHAGAAWLVGYQVRRLTLGQGPLLRRWRWKSFQIDAELGNTEKACEAMKKQLDELPKDSPFRPILLNNLAWYTLDLDQPELLRSALVMSREAHEKMKAAPWAKGTLGAILVARGDAAAGEPLLRAALDYNESARSRAHNAAWLAVAAAQRSRRTQAERWLAVARALDPDCRSIARSEKALAADYMTGAAAA